MKKGLLIGSIIVFVLFSFVSHSESLLQGISDEDKIINSDAIVFVRICEGVSKNMINEFNTVQKYELLDTKLYFFAIAEIIQIMKGEIKSKYITINYEWIGSKPSYVYLETNKYYLLFLKGSNRNNKEYIPTYPYYYYSIGWSGEKNDLPDSVSEKIKLSINEINNKSFKEKRGRP